ncbi:MULTISPECIES: hypothetical protein [unclassified Bacillus (in: firmicutes)]|uniref:hypothetical protein n=1 Tax=unclassified Bacillus (in: firmicutes) TaxID=185979 RepID=UPI001FCDD3D5|nr:MULTISPECIES: hypothetical protein [unclassified Bacillus (in: firmicutes)]
MIRYGKPFSEEAREQQKTPFLIHLKKCGNKTSDFFGNLVDDPKGALEDAKYGLIDFVESSIDDTKEEFKDIYEFIGDLWNEEIQKMYVMRFSSSSSLTLT